MMNIRIIRLSILFLIPAGIYSQSIVNTVHNLSVSGPGQIKASSESEICIFCHTPHNSGPVSPLWNRNDPGLNYTLYNSTTIQATIGQPDGASLLCLSCHDGTIALGNVLSRPVDIDFTSGITTLPPGVSNLTTDLTNDHPVSFVYNSSLAAADGELVDPINLTWPIKLENEKLQCTACHDPHKNIYTDFLILTTQFSNLCTECHDKNYWVTTSHRNSNAIWNGSGIDPWFHTPYSSVAENACENCHNPHNAGLDQRLMNYQAEESNCLNCHNSNVAVENILVQLNKPYSHNVYGYNLVHDASEDELVLTQHVECEDCHNPHAARNLAANAPFVSGFLEGVKGINQNGGPVNPAQYEYELCYRCHADSPDKPASPTSRQIEQNNVRFEFDLSNPSYHPVVGVGKNPDCPSLISPLTESSIIYCSHCHASDGTNSPAGPHGSMYPQILKFNYTTADNTQESYQAYRLCYECHDRATVISDEPNNFQNRVHHRHIVEENTPCNACHDPHGISSSQGNSTNNTHLINFDLSIVEPSFNGQLRFEDQGSYAGRCYLNCHGKNHSPRWY
ncbi:MAG: hypothetical protein KQI35_06220 [Bacteroidetes bacterium]|nr:hypothetical protein [Bacteroidota bacterium]